MQNWELVHECEDEHDAERLHKQTQLTAENQFPPVGGNPLYMPISLYAGQNDSEVQKRLGQLAWKMVNTIVNLTDQQQMKEDPEYGDAVNHLRVRKCTEEDVDLFNSRLIKSATHQNGIDMGDPENFNAAAIVGTNELWEVLNAQKAETACGNRNKLVVCAALDKLSNCMPVILQVHNLSTDLGITNGLQDCTEGKQEKIRVTRHQVPIQPAFTVTGHSAQGKTLPQVIVNLHEGGFAAYVSASHAQTHKGLCITQPVMVEFLNKCIPSDLSVKDTPATIQAPSTGCKWSPLNWSCAYDSVFMSDPQIFPRFGPVVTSVCAVFDHLFPEVGRQLLKVNATGLGTMQAVKILNFVLPHCFGFSFGFGGKQRS
ncbi:hypothetical protein BDR07DRAFT_1383930 [Suillus spraguei]|nr:hypothetical protein BDR07DRAFT_1383930 [Suillus spraguei]